MGQSRAEQRSKNSKNNKNSEKSNCNPLHRPFFITAGINISPSFSCFSIVGGGRGRVVAEGNLMDGLMVIEIAMEVRELMQGIALPDQHTKPEAMSETHAQSLDFRRLAQLLHLYSQVPRNYPRVYFPVASP